MKQKHRNSLCVARDRNFVNTEDMLRSSEKDVTQGVLIPQLCLISERRAVYGIKSVIWKDKVPMHYYTTFEPFLDGWLRFFVLGITAEGCTCVS